MTIVCDVESRPLKDNIAVLAYETLDLSTTGWTFLQRVRGDLLEYLEMTAFFAMILVCGQCSTLLVCDSNQV
jgi:hypothetical protein